MIPNMQYRPSQTTIFNNSKKAFPVNKLKSNSFLSKNISRNIKAFTTLEKTVVSRNHAINLLKVQGSRIFGASKNSVNSFTLTLLPTGETEFKGWLKGHRKLTAFDFHGNNLITGSEDGTCKIWQESPQGDTSQEYWSQFILNHQSSPVNCLQVTNDTLVVGTNTSASTWSLKTLERQIFDRNAITGLALTSSKIATISDYFCKIWNLESLKLTSVVKHESLITGLQLEEKRLVTSSDTICRLWDPNLHNLSTFQDPIKEFCHEESVKFFQFENNTLVTGTNKGCYAWDLNSGKCKRKLPFDFLELKCLHLSGKYLATGSSDHYLRVWNIQTGNYTEFPFVSGIEKVVLSDSKLIVGTGTGNISVFTLNIPEKN